MPNAESLRRIVVAIVLILVCIVAAYVPALFLTWLLLPLWSWVEATYGIESVGHASVADWCFELVYGVCLAAALVFTYARRRRQRSRADAAAPRTSA